MVKKEEADIQTELNKKVGSIGNIVYHDVPVAKDEKKNELVSQWGEISQLEVDGKSLGHLYHHEVMQCLDIVEFERGQKLSGHRGYFLRGAGVLLN